MAAAGLVDQSARTRINPYPASARWGLGWDSVQQLVLVASDGSLTLRSWSATGWTTLQEKLRARTDGDWWTDGKDDRCYRFQTEDGHRYLIQRDLSSN